jgi:hypothetical protein
MENTLNLNKFQIAAARRAYQSEKMSIRQLRKVEAKIEKLMNEKAILMAGIEAFDAPIKAFTGGIGAEETLRILGILKEENTEDTATTMEAEAPQTEEDAQTFPVAEETPATNSAEMPEWMKIAEEELK